MATAPEIWFVTDSKYDFLINSYPCDVMHGSYKYQSAEHLFQSLKFEGFRPKIVEAVQKSSDPLIEAHKAENEDHIRPDWFDVNKTMILLSIWLKFTQNSELAQKLKETKGTLINNVEDPFWGIGADRKGGNEFGKALMKLRDEIYGNNLPPPSLSPYRGQQIKFYEREKPHYCFTNFCLKNPVQLPQGVKWKTSEHLFQAFKFTGPRHKQLVKQIFDSPTPRQVFKLAQDNSNARRSDWKNISIQVMRHVVYLKFKQNQLAQAELVATKGHELIEDSPDDEFWGCGSKGEGRNELGKALMRIRNILIHNLPPPPPPEGPIPQGNM